MIYPEPPCSWRFVDSTSKLSKNISCAKCDQYVFQVQTDPSLLLPFIWSGTTFYTPTSFWLRSFDGGLEINLASYMADIKTFTIGTTVYVAFQGQSFDVMTSPLTVGLYQCEVSDGINTIYSEPIRICEDTSHCLRMQWTNSCDIAGIPYTYLATVITGGFINVMFIENSPILQSEYETEKEESTNLLRQRTVIYQSQERIMRFKSIGSHWVVKALKAVELHDNVDVYTEYDSSTATYTYLSSDVQDVEITLSDLDELECQQEIEVKFRQDDAIISGICCVSESPEACLESCYTVAGFTPVGECTEGLYYIDDIDSGVIKRCVGGVLTTVSSTCTYVFNSVDNNYYYYNGDLWFVTPDIDVLSVTNPTMSTALIQIEGFTIPGTWVYIYYSCDNVTFTMYPTPFTAAQLASGISITVPFCNDSYYLYCSSQNHTCTYDDSDLVTVVPE